MFTIPRRADFMLPTTADRVSNSTSDEINEEIRRTTQESVARHGRGGTAAIDRRLAELDAEWDVERTLEANASTLSLVGLSLAATVNRKWIALPIVVQAFLLQHALQGWCPPLPILRRLGFRTAEEINRERYALKALRGDFEGARSDVDAATRAVER
jgi:hypothetical protein